MSDRTKYIVQDSQAKSESPWFREARGLKPMQVWRVTKRSSRG